MSDFAVAARASFTIKPKLYFDVDAECWVCEWFNQYQGCIVGYSLTKTGAYGNWKLLCEDAGWTVDRRTA